MWGVTFLPGTRNSLICGTANFEVQSFSGAVNRYKLNFSPEGMILVTNNREHRSVTPANVQAILPRKEDSGMDWTWDDFLIAMTFWGEGENREK